MICLKFSKISQMMKRFYFMNIFFYWQKIYKINDFAGDTGFHIIITLYRNHCFNRSITLLRISPSTSFPPTIWLHPGVSDTLTIFWVTKSTATFFNCFASCKWASTRAWAAFDTSRLSQITRSQTAFNLYQKIISVSYVNIFSLHW